MLVQRRYCQFLPVDILPVYLSQIPHITSGMFAFNQLTVSGCKFTPVPSCGSVLVIACRTGVFVRFFVASEVKRRRSVRHARREKAQKK